MYVTGKGPAHHTGRWYDANQGRFISEDPIGFGGGDANLNRYASNSPVNLRDPSGLIIEEALISTVLGGGNTVGAGVVTGNPILVGIGLGITLGEKLRDSSDFQDLTQNIEDEFKEGIDEIEKGYKKAVKPFKKLWRSIFGGKDDPPPPPPPSLDDTRTDDSVTSLSGSEQRRIERLKQDVIYFEQRGDQAGADFTSAAIQQATRGPGYHPEHDEFLRRQQTIEGGPRNALDATLRNFASTQILLTDAITIMDEVNERANGFRYELRNGIGTADLPYDVRFDPDRAKFQAFVEEATNPINYIPVGAVLNRGRGATRQVAGRGLSYLGRLRAPVRGSSFDDVVGSINHNADVATELTRRATARGRITDGPQAFGTRAHVLFERLNNRLDTRLTSQGSPFRVATEEFRNAAGQATARRARGSIGADAIIRSTDDFSVNSIFDLKTHGGIEVQISPSRQGQFQIRFGTPAQEIFRQR